ncbi:MAG: restriction endonuclease subunit S [Clostridium sp.]|uniref:restriction endonuclease subunit S n=1 Tax=Clostridium sp. TaxID=1506 RepID=UPI002904EFE8|nr:restriction endonuclease subunit S [Clostridium sp.]MDU3090002.1 restriction endonuclease subunit S [Clostridium sp.]
MNKNKEKVPKIRFPGFTEPWEQRKVGEFLTESKIKGSDGSKAKKLTVKLWRKGIVPKEEIYQGSSATQYYVRKSGQFMYGKLDFLNQAFGIVPPELDGYESTLDSPAFDFKDGINSGFFLEYISLKRFYKYQGNTANGSRKAKRIHADTFFEMPISVPRHDEQKKIGSFFQNIDNLITLHQRKLNHLKDKKKGLLQKMFPKNGELVPELRFPEFTDPWEQRKLGDVVSYIVDNRGKNPTYYCSEGIPVIDNFMIKNTLYPELGTATRFIDEELYQNFIRKYNEIDDILLTLVGNGIGNISLFPADKAVIIQNTLGLRTDENKRFLFFLLMSKNQEIVKLDRGMAQPSIRQDEILDISIKIPKMEEQEKIGTYFSNLDNLITLHQRKLDHLKEQKKALLQQMFI